MSNTENRRKLQNFVIDPKAQMRLAQPFGVLLLISVGMVMMIFWQIFSLHGDMGDSVHAQDLPVLKTILSKVVLTASLGIGLMGLLAVSLWIYFSHRIFGPVVPIRRHIKNLMDGNFSGEIKLRSNDEFKDIAGDLNELTRHLAKQLGK
jgi:HAMP domain-containing protein